MGKRNRFVNPDVTKLDLSDGDWIEVKRRLNVAERRSITSRAAKGGVSTDSTRVFVDANEMEFAKVEAWVLDWSFTDAADKRVKFSPEAVRALDPDTFAEIIDAIDAHEKAEEAAKNSSASVASSSSTPASDASTSVASSPSA